MTASRTDLKRERLAARRQLRELVAQADRLAAVPVARFSSTVERRDPIAMHTATYGGRRIG